MILFISDELTRWWGDEADIEKLLISNRWYSARISLYTYSYVRVWQLDNDVYHGAMVRGDVRNVIVVECSDSSC